MKPQRAQRNTLRTLKEYPFKDITEKIISCAIEVHSSLGPGLLENLAENLRIGLLINFNVDKLKEGIRRVIL